MKLMHVVALTVVVASVGLSGCDLPSPADVRTAMEDELFQSLECEDLARPSTLARMRAALDAPSLETFGALATDPADLATVVSFAGAEVEGVMLAAHTLDIVAASGPVHDLLEGGWDGVQCGEAVPLGCTAGEQATVVRCDQRAQKSVTSIELTFARCTIGGTIVDGALTFARLPKDDTHASLDIARFSIDESKVLDGGARVDIANDGAFAATLLDRGFEFLEHGGIDGGLECGATLAVAALAFDLDGDGATVKLDGVRATTEEKVALRTVGDDLRFEKDARCACPLPGSGLFIDVPRPLGREGVTAGATITWSAPDDAATSCARADVSLSDWPADCLVAEECAKDATEQLLSSVFTAMCARDR